MAKFTMAVEGFDGDEVEFKSEVDADGDFVVYANGYMLLFICRESGKLSLCDDIFVDGIATDNNGQIEIDD